MSYQQVFPNHRPGWYDTLAIAKAKWLAELNQHKAGFEGLTTRYSSTQARDADTKLITLQKILQKEVEG